MAGSALRPSRPLGIHAPLALSFPQGVSRSLREITKERGLPIRREIYLWSALKSATCCYEFSSAVCQMREQFRPVVTGVSIVMAVQTQTAIRGDAIRRRFAEYEPAECQEAKASSSEIPQRLPIAGGVLRGLFILSLLIVTMRVGMPQREHIWTAYASPADLIRMILGFVVCVWLAKELFNVPRDTQAYRAWLYLS